MVKVSAAIASIAFVTVVLVSLYYHNLHASSRFSPDAVVRLGDQVTVADEPASNTIHLALLIGGLDACQQALTMLKSLLYYMGRHLVITSSGCAPHPETRQKTVNQPILLHLIVDGQSHRFLASELGEWNLSRVRVEYYQMETYLELVRHLKSGHYSGSRSYIKLLLPSILPNYVSQVIMLDTDILFNVDVRGLWAFFQRFNSKQAIGMVRDQNPYLRDDIGKLYWPEWVNGYNAGILLLDLKRLRNTNWDDRWMQTFRTLSSELGVLPTAEQDVINMVVYEDKDLLFELPCEWNLQMGAFSWDPECPVKWWPLHTADSANLDRQESSPLRELRIAHFNAHIKPEKYYPKPWRLPEVKMENRALTKRELAWTYIKSYYQLRGMNRTCFY